MAEKTLRSVRIEDDLWDAAAERAALEHRPVSDVIRVALRAYAAGSYAAKATTVRRRE